MFVYNKRLYAEKSGQVDLFPRSIPSKLREYSPGVIDEIPYTRIISAYNVLDYRSFLVHEQVKKARERTIGQVSVVDQIRYRINTVIVHLDKRVYDDYYRRAVL